MHHRLSPPAALLIAALAVGVGACEVSSPASPSMSFGTPTGQAPETGAAYNFAQQPITLTIINVPRTGSGSVTYDVEVATSDNFATIVVSRTGIAEGQGATTVTLPTLDGGQTYHWRSRAVVDGVAGAWSAIQSFLVRPNVVLHVPAPLSPSDGAPVFTERPTFTVQNAGRTGEPGTVTYQFQVAESSAFATILAEGSVVEEPGQTSWSPTVDLPLGILHWRVRAVDAANAVMSDFSGPRAFDRRPSTGDEIDLRSVTVVLGPTNIADWPATGRVTGTVAQPGLVCIDHTLLGSWPGTIFFDDPGVLVQGNQWMFAFIDGKWYGGSGRWFRPGQPCKDTLADDGFGGTFYQDFAEPLRSYIPRIGDTIGLMSSTPNRFYPDMATVDERTNVVLVRWGG